MLVKQSGVFILSYNVRNRLVGSTVGALTSSYGVNDFGRRVTKTRATTGTAEYFAYFHDLSGQILGSYDANGAAREEIVWLGDLPVATLQGGAAYYIMPDHLGAPHQIVNSANAQVWLWDHDPFGNGAPLSAAGFSHDLRFPGQIYDSETRLHNNGFRDYSPALGRYVESDPVGLAGGINTYAYAGNDPVNRIDPLGLDPASKDDPNALPLIDVGAIGARCVAMCHGSDPGYGRPITPNEAFVLQALTFAVALPVGGWAFGGRAVMSGPALARALGKAGEQAVGLSGPKARILIPGSNRVRIPDAITNTTLTEVKNVDSLSYTRQLRDFANYADQNGLQFDLYVRSNTQLTGPLQKAVESGAVNLRIIPGQ